jgi:multisubunit Na+/H+ antiporter MnhB subunit
LEKSHPIAALGMLAGGATTILLIITENKLPLGVKLPEHLDANIYGISISLLLFVTISTYHNNKKRHKMEFKIINNSTGQDKIYTIKSLLNFFSLT